MSAVPHAGEHRGLRLVEVRSPRGDKTYRLPETYARRSITECIRSLAGLGWSRAEISKVTGILYQHVRNVLEQGGSGIGLIPSPAPNPTAPSAANTVEQDHIGSMIPFAGLVARVERGEELKVTRNGVPVARITQVEPSSGAEDAIKPEVRAAMERMDARRKQFSLRGLSIKDLINEGRH